MQRTCEMLSVEPATLSTRSWTPGTALDTPALQPVRSRRAATVAPPLPMIVPASRDEMMARRSTTERLLSVAGEPEASADEAFAGVRGVPRLARGPRGVRLAGVFSAAGESGAAALSSVAAPAGAGESVAAAFFLRGVRLDVLGLAAGASAGASSGAA